MRIVGGRWRGLGLTPVGKGDEAARLRPTADRVREALFNMLTNGAHGNLVTEARVLDLFAGTGALGLEALSRGARHTTFVDDGRTAQSLIRRNVDRARCADQMTLVARNALRLGRNPGAPCTLVFLDPPYGRGLGAPALDAARAGGWLAPGATIVWEEAEAQQPPAGCTPLDTRRFGAATVTLLRADGEGRGGAGEPDSLG